jgi:hypothetical protein
MKQKAKSEADAILKENLRQIELETGRALRQIRNEVADLSVAMMTERDMLISYPRVTTPNTGHAQSRLPRGT